MADGMTWYSDVKDGKLQKNISTLIASYLKDLDGKRVEIKIQRKVQHRSNEQNAYLHVLLTILTAELNKEGNHYKMSTIKNIMKCKFLQDDVVDETSGEVLGTQIRDTSDLNKEEMITFIDSIKQWAAEQDIYLPDAGE